ncbi:TIGR02594 family protein [Nonlabens ulvanivorans]|uniref:TIGR02594 family protein n=1 Tax=Nonlabens ulvanivorans TaxID=906888 RepID=UPI0029436731|nr:TIGR02594 family protein [Nonlabens ulvanivorans]WOI22889.1 TIGR02594 family protein [Nonlabens ulvanivorans]
MSKYIKAKSLVLFFIIFHYSIAVPATKLINDVDNLNSIINFSTLPSNNLGNNILSILETDSLELINENNYSKGAHKFFVRADVSEGTIGAKSLQGTDDINDNIFKFNLKKFDIENYTVELQYELFGLKSLSGVSRSINAQPSYGGYESATSDSWSLIKEPLNNNWVDKRINTIIFNNSNQNILNFKVKNVKLVFTKAEVKSTTNLIITSKIIDSQNQIYFRGFLIDYTEETSLILNDKEINLYEGAFETIISNNIEYQGFIDLSVREGSKLKKNYKISISQSDRIDSSLKTIEKYSVKTSDVPMKTSFNISGDDYKLIINDSALSENKKIAVSKLRKTDLPPMSPGLINVTKGATAFRFLPDGTKFNNLISLHLGYDENLLPAGFDENDITTFYFDTNAKKWKPIVKDSVIIESKMIVSRTDHFTDYINGVIQAPESPETAGFTPTSLSDIKAVDPSAQMTLISPPQVSQSGSANVSFPIKIPSGRNGMQPQLAISYNSDAGTGWLGQGWSLSMPAITINSSWGTPKFNSANETEIYSMSGEQLMYPKRNGSDWMPHRHADVNGTTYVTPDVSPLPRTADLEFTLRKQGSFTQIIRKGNSPSTYYWKVVAPDGTIHYYGGSNAVDPDAVITDVQGNIVHWALVQSIDVYGNTVAYQYDTDEITGLSGDNQNLNGGISHLLNNVKYNGFNNSNYSYEVELVKSTSIRNDATIDASLGIKIVDVYQLNEIKVKNLKESQLIRSYKTVFGQGRLSKSQLRSVAEHDGSGNFFYEHTFDYYNDLGVGNESSYFDGAITIEICDEVDPCIDSDGDGVCDDDDPCPDVVGSISNNGCPEEELICYTLQLPTGGNWESECYPLGSFVQLDGVTLNNSHVYGPQQITNLLASNISGTVSLNTTTNEVTINNTLNVLQNLKLYNDFSNGVYSTCVEDIPFVQVSCGDGATIPVDTYTVIDGAIDEDCQDFLFNWDFLITGSTPTFNSNGSPLGSSKTTTKAVGFSIGAGIGTDPTSKSTSIAFQKNYSANKSKSLSSSIDIDGDGLEDLVYKEHDKVYYKKHVVERVVNSLGIVVPQHSFEPKKQAIGINEFYRAHGTSRTENIQVTAGQGNAGVFLGGDQSRSKSTNDIYFTDANGDGLIDVAKNGVIYFNRLNASGIPTFVRESDGSENLVITAAPATVVIPEEIDEFDFPNLDVVKVWEAPEDSKIRIDNDAILLDLNSSAILTIEGRIDLSAEDPNTNEGVICNDNVRNIGLIHGVELNSSQPTFTDTLGSNLNNIFVKKGDKIYFRIHSNDGSNPKVSWDPKVTLAPNPYFNYQIQYDANGITPLVNRYSESFVLNDNKPLVYPSFQAGTASITWDAYNVTPTDEMVFSVHQKVLEKNSSNSDQLPTVISDTTLYTLVCPPNVTTAVNALNLNNIAVVPQLIGNQPNLERETVFEFRVKSTSNVDWQTYQWKPQVEFNYNESISTDTDRNHVEGVHQSVTTHFPVVNHDLYRMFPCGPIFRFQKALISNYQSSTLGLSPNINNLFSNGDNGIINFIVKRGNQFVDKRVLQITNGVVTNSNNNPIIITGSGADEFEVMFTTNDENRPYTDSSLLQNLANVGNTQSIVNIQENGVYSAFSNYYVALYQKGSPIQGAFYRSWGQFMYDASKVVDGTPTGFGDTQLIDEKKININYITANMSQSDLTDFENDLENVDENTDLDALYQSSLALTGNFALYPAKPLRKVIPSGFLEKWIGDSEENYSSALGARASSVEQSIDILADEDMSIYQGPLFTGAYAIDRKTRSNSIPNIALGGTFGVGGVNGTTSDNGRSINLSDYVDHNGDRYPDLVTIDEVQYTNSTGGLIAKVDDSRSLGDGENSGVGFSASGSFGKSGESGGDANSKKSTAYIDWNNGRTNNSMGFSGSFNTSENETNHLWLDINGDGLSDEIEQSINGASVRLNLGPTNHTTQQMPTTNWGTLPLIDGDGSSVSGGLGLNLKVGSIEIGTSLSTSWSNSENFMTDINGDGLIDIIDAKDDLEVRLNLGNKFETGTSTWSDFNMKKESTSTSSSLNIGATIAVVVPLIFINLKVLVLNANGTPYSSSTNKTKKALTDYDGDGYLDIVESISNSTVKVRHSRIRRTDKLMTVNNPLGGSFTIDYEVQPVTYDNPHAKWTMSEVIIDDGYDTVNDGEDQYSKSFTYEGGRYDRRERAFFGFATVKVQDFKELSNGNREIYRTTVSNYHNRTYFTNGLLESSYVLKGDNSNQIFSKTLNEYTIYGLNDTNDQLILNDVKPFDFDSGGSEGRRSAAVFLTKTRTEHYELNNSPQLITENVMTYNIKGELAVVDNKGDITTNSDNVKTQIYYHNNTNLASRNIRNVPYVIRVRNASNTLLRERRAFVNSNTGHVNRMWAKIGSLWAWTDMKYDQFGNLTRIIYPENTANQRMSYTYTYDSNYHKFITDITDSFGYSSQSDYDGSFDHVNEVTDYAGNKMIYSYDTFGRTTSVQGPKEIASGQPYTIKFDYYPYQSLLPQSANMTAAEFVPVAMTSHYDPEWPSNDIETYTFIDGMSRPIQVKKDISYNIGSINSPNMIEALSISGKSTADEFGRGIEQFHPTWESKTFSTNFKLNETATAYSSTVEYDELDRTVKTIDPEGNESTMSYDIDTDVDGTMAFKTVANVDQNGSQNVITESFADVFGRTISTKNVDPVNGDIWTKFSYNAISELQSYTDADNLTTTYKYDMFGRKTEVNHPDNGKTTYTYDKVNLTKLSTEKLSVASQFISYEYDYSRLSKVIFPEQSPGVPNLANVEYQYGATGNQTGRLVYQKDATGTQTMEYGNLGELIYSSRTVVGPNIPTRVYDTHFVYDTWNRLQEMTYPDGEEIDFYYDFGGNMNKMVGELNGAPYEYVERLEYDHFEQRTYLKYGNGTETNYEYTPALRRLNNLKVQEANGNYIFDNDYGYDKIGNVTSLNNSASSSSHNNMGGSYTHEYGYDALNRLIEANGEFSGHSSQSSQGNDSSAAYSLSMSYNKTHSIVTKNQNHNKNGTAFQPNTFENSYDLIAGTHQVEKVTDGLTGVETTLEYDLNGNVVNKSVTELDDTNYYWDEVNRLRVVAQGENSMQHYIYDGTGNRILKAATDYEAVYENGTLVDGSGNINIIGYKSYPSAHIVVDENGIYSKHYYLGTQRIVSRLGDDNASIFEVEGGGESESLKSFKGDDGAATLNPKDLQNAQKSDLVNLLKETSFNNFVYKKYEGTTIEEQKNRYERLDQGKDEKEIEKRAPVDVPIYFYHPDHLGTTNALTDVNGNMYQFFLNLPFGETMAEQTSISYYQTEFKFNGKELDNETGMYYYGARYYDPSLSIWMSVDPLAEQFPNFSPYNYTMNNPINMIDPDGRAAEGPDRYGPDPDKVKKKEKLIAAFKAIAEYIKKSDEKIAAQKAEAAKAEQERMAATPWMDTARSQLGVKETKRNGGTKVDKYLKTTGLPTDNPWCGAFVNWTLEQNDMETVPNAADHSTHKARAKSYRTLGVSLTKPAIGAIATKSRKGGGHVGFVAGITSDGKIVLLGGNQNDSVNYTAYSKDILQFNYPNGYTPNYTLPVLTVSKTGTIKED